MIALERIVRKLHCLVKYASGSFLAAIMFYTCLPVPSRWCTKFETVARFAPSVGLLVGGLLGITDLALLQLHVPVATRSVLVVLLWIGLTGGLHLDGVLDTADGLAVPDPQRRLAVMADSRVGAFGAIAGASVILLKASALSDIDHYRALALIVIAGWGRWGQQLAIACYPYLRPQGKGAVHKQALTSAQSTLPSLLLLLVSHGILTILAGPWVGLGSAAASSVTAWAVGAWLHRRLGGHTGDTYGAVVEWTEAIALVAFATLLNAVMH